MADSKETTRSTKGLICGLPGIIIPSFLYFIGLFMFFGLVNQILIDQVCLHTDNDDCDSSEVSSTASSLSVVVTMTATLPQLFANGFYAELSNKYGRKFPLVISSAGNVAFISAGLLVTMTDSPYYFYILNVGSLLSGISGGIPVFIMSMFAYAADVTRLEPSKRTVTYSVTEASIFVPNMISPVVAGVLAKTYGFSMPVAVALAATLLCVLWLLFIPESLPINEPTRDKDLSFSVMDTFRNIAFLFTHKVNGVSGTSPLPYVSAAFFLFFAIYWGDASVVVFYLKHKFSWGSDFIGYFQGAVGTVYVFSMVCAPSIATKLRSGKPFRLMTWIQIGYASRIAYYAIFGLAPNIWWLYGNILLILLAGPIVPYTRTLLSNCVPHSEQARVFSGFAGLETIASFISVVFVIIYSATVKAGLSQLIYFLFSAFVCGSLVLVFYVTRSPIVRANLPDAATNSSGKRGGEPPDGGSGCCGDKNNNNNNREQYTSAPTSEKNDLEEDDRRQPLLGAVTSMQDYPDDSIDEMGPAFDDDDELKARSESIDLSSVVVMH